MQRLRRLESRSSQRPPKSSIRSKMLQDLGAKMGWMRAWWDNICTPHLSGSWQRLSTVRLQTAHWTMTKRANREAQISQSRNFCFEKSDTKTETIRGLIGSAPFVISTTSLGNEVVACSHGHVGRGCLPRIPVACIHAIDGSAPGKLGDGTPICPQGHPLWRHLRTKDGVWPRRWLGMFAPLCQTLGVLHGRETFLVCSLRFTICMLLHLCAFHPSSSLFVKEYSIPSCLEIPATMIFLRGNPAFRKAGPGGKSHAPLPTDRDGQV